ncbi:dioxygenase [uncultured Jatrophihabitans sp.]|uniref:dioxygenase family protein n=1 Tax=uncultured Jatrophihabitans sp. TaxID=1610747 RepID=UPI0035CB825C
MDPTLAGVDGSVDPALTQRVLDSFEDSVSPRFRQVMRSLVTHLHAFASDVSLTEDEWASAIEFVTRIGQISDDSRHEAILLSDVLGLSMLTIGINHPPAAPVTESTVIGPFFVEGSPEFANGDDISGGASGQPCFYSGTVTGLDGQPLPHALLEIWHSDEDGNYDVQYADRDSAQGRGHLRADAFGRYWFSSVLPEPYPIPQDGPVGDLLTAARRSPMRPAHVHFMIAADGFVTLITHVFRDGDPYLGNDAVFGEKDSLVRAFEARGPGVAPDGRQLDEFFTMRYDFVLQRSVDTPAPLDPREPSIGSADDI